ncbi:MAG TPA: SDR family NAD(P)-dependent oxidoreductase [Rubrobacter sp.]|nr:SDR family NAD(P)-dependent oxidoreductase [Rubrobacter sp.]
MAAWERDIPGVALVTGGARGIGFEVARQLAQRGMTVLVGARDHARAEAAAQELAGENLDVRARTIDVTDSEGVKRLAAGVDEEFGKLDVLVNNAAVFAEWSETASAADLESSRAVFDTNLFGAWRVCQAFLPLIHRSEHGRIVNVSSGAGSHGEPTFGLTTGGGAAASYGISKAAINALTAKLAAELEGTAILVNSVDPGLTATAPGMEEMGARPIPDGAASVVWAATLPDEGPTGGFFRDGEPLPW